MRPAAAPAAGPGDDVTAAAGADGLAGRLVARGLVDAAALARAMALVASEGGGRVALALVRLGAVREADLAAAAAEALGLLEAGPGELPAAPVLPERINPKFLKRHRALPLGADDGTVTLAMADPTDEDAAEAVALASGLAVARKVARPSLLDGAIERLYAGVRRAGAAADGEGEFDVGRLKDLASEAPVIQAADPHDRPEPAGRTAIARTTTDRSDACARP
jgi:general secretion pathway protein E